MAVTRLEITARALFAEGQEFGEAGAYERIDGLLTFAVDPTHPANEQIVDLALARRDSDGLVRFTADFCLLQPADPARGNRRLLFDVLNRGNKLAVRTFNRGPRVLAPTAEINPGDGFLFRRGWSVAWAGWQWDVVRSPALLGLNAPDALDPDGAPIQGEVTVQILTNTRQADHQLSDRAHRPFPAANVDDRDAEMTVSTAGGGREIVPRGRWRFARDEGGQPVPDDERVWLEGGFEPGRVYRVRYRTRLCPVAGAGLLAARDTGAFLRYGDAANGNVGAGRIDHTFAFGSSQSGRFLRTLLYHGLNVDEDGRRVFDGVWANIAGSGRAEVNSRYAQPSALNPTGPGALPPFTDSDQTDALGGSVPGLLHRQRTLGGVPLVFLTNTASEYWRGDGSLAHTDLAGERDVEPGEGVRLYFFAGTQHSPGALPLMRVSPIDGASGLHPFNTVDYSPLMRAGLESFDGWVTDGVAPPPNRFPRLADGTAVPRDTVLQTFAAIPTASLPDPAALRSVGRRTTGEGGNGATRPRRTGADYPAYASAVDGDGTELAGVRLPEVAVPVGTHAGWNPRDPATGGAGMILALMGATLPFPATAEERARTSDPRQSIEERYGDRDGYLARVSTAAQELVRERWLLPEDVELVVKLAGRSYDAFMAKEAVGSRQ